VAKLTVNPTLEEPIGTVGFVWIPPGTFVMGSPWSEPNRQADEVQHTVTLTQGFWLSDHEVTQAEYLAVTGYNPSLFQEDLNRPSWKQDLNRPVERVSWNEAVLYCQKLTNRERAAGRIFDKQEYRLPTEAEWEYAARAGTTGPYYGNLDAIAWWLGNFSVNNNGQMRSVKQRAANAWGLHDMLGNVKEWCSDWYGDYPTQSVSDPRGPYSGSDRVLRGGGWLDDASVVRAARRLRGRPDGSMQDLGFRPALSWVL
jgi:formylglycine-generating enzyme required for sulfatase activity